MSDPVLDTIDHVLHDYEISGDAMRWVPEPIPAAPPVPQWDPVAFSAAVERFADAYRSAMRGFVQKLNDLSPVLLHGLRLMQAVDAEAKVHRSDRWSEYHRRQKRRSRR